MSRYLKLSARRRDTVFFFFQAEDGIRDKLVTGVQTCALPILRLLFVKLGTQHCPDCEVPIEPQSEEAIAARILREYRGETVVMLAPLVVNRDRKSTRLTPVTSLSRMPSSA